MRKILGGVVLVAGVGGLGWYGSAYNAKTMQATVTSGAAEAAQGTIHPIQTRVSGRDVLVSGIANSDAEKEQIMGAMHDVPGRRVIREELRVLDTASPFALTAAKAAEDITYSGAIPTEVDRAVLASQIGDGARELELMAGAPDSNWTAVAGRGLGSLELLEDGTLSVSDRTVTLTGTALGPDQEAAARAALNDLPQGYDARFDIDLLDDGTPLRLAIDLAEDGAIIAAGKTPAGFDTATLSPDLAGDDIAQSVLPSAVANWSDTAALGASALGALRSGKMTLTEDTLSISGVATPQGKASAEARIASLPDGFTATSDIALYDDGEPFSFMLDKTAEGGTKASGKFPVDVAAADIVGDVPAGDIRNAYIGDESGGFAAVSAQGTQALAQLESGTLSVVGTDVTLTGVAKSPTEMDAAMGLLGNLPDGYTAQFDVASIDDGTPPSFDVVYSAAEGVSVSGKLPADTDVADIAGALGIADVAGNPVQGITGEGAQALAGLNAASNWLPELDQLTFSSNDADLSVNAIATPGVDQDLVQAGLAETMGEGVAVAVAAQSDLPQDGATRTNQATGRAETFTAGFWLPIYDFAADTDNCNTQSANAVSENRIAFLSGSAQLDAQSVRAINAVAAIVRKCLAETDLTVEIGGYTDSQGGEDLNLELSQTRADAVRTALIARGAGEASIIAKGYGEANPIADNETEEGRAANRRTTITWFTPEVAETADTQNADTQEANTEDGDTQDADTQDTSETDDAAATDTNTDTEVGE